MKTRLSSFVRVGLACLAGALALAGSPAQAQFSSVSPVYQAWAPTGRAALAVTAASARVQLGSVAPVARICNTGTKDVFIAFGIDNTIVATVTGWYVPFGHCPTFSTKPFATQYTWLAAIAGGADTSSLIIETGIGSPGGN